MYGAKYIWDNYRDLSKSNYYEAVPGTTKEDFKRRLEILPGKLEETESSIIKYLDHDVLIGFYEPEEDKDEGPRIIVSFDHMTYIKNKQPMKSNEETIVTNLYFCLVWKFIQYILPSTDDPQYKEYLNKKKGREENNGLQFL